MGYVQLAMAVVGAAVQQDEARKTRNLNREIQSEQRAANKGESMRERRQQIREERVRRAALLQQSEATGTVGSSGEIGSLGGMSTALSSNIGTNLGKLQTAENISIFQQGIADSQYRAALAKSINDIAQSASSSYSGTK